MKYISLLRGINVSGKKKIKMTDLKSLYEDFGFNNVITYIQSGNVLFDSDISGNQTLIEKIENAIIEKYDFSVPVILRTAEEWKSVIDNNPFSDIDPVGEGSRFLVTFFSDPPEMNLLQTLENYRAESERFKVIVNHAYLHCPGGYGKTKLSNSLIEKKLHVSATTRNWKTVLKLYELSTDL